jgi:hypothetical protein
VAILRVRHAGESDAGVIQRKKRRYTRASCAVQRALNVINN